MALFLLVSGLPWAQGWGGYLQAVRTLTAGQPVRQDWTRGGGAAPSAHAGHDMAMPAAAPAAPHAPIDRLATRVAAMGLAPPVLLVAPATPGAPWTARSETGDRPRRTEVTLDPVTAAVLTRRDFATRPLVDRLVGYGIAVHEGQLFGWANLLLNLVTAAGLLLVAVSSVVLWWRRRPQGTIGAPPGGRSTATAPLVAILILLGILLPLFGASLIAVLLVERLLLARLPGPARWLGLAPVRRYALPS